MKLFSNLLKGKRKAIFFDLEGSQFTQEIIAIGAIKAKLDAKGDLVSIERKTFEVYVKCHGDVGPVVEKLTHINNEKLKNDGLAYHTAMQKFIKFVGKNPEEYAFIAYGSFDKTLLFNTDELNNFPFKEFDAIVARNYVDYAKFVSQFMKNDSHQTPSLVDAIMYLGGVPYDNVHDPLCDSQNLVLLFKLMRENKDNLKEQYKRTMLQSPYPTPIINILKKLNSNQSVTPVDYEQYLNDYFKWL